MVCWSSRLQLRQLQELKRCAVRGTVKDRKETAWTPGLRLPRESLPYAGDEDAGVKAHLPNFILLTALRSRLSNQVAPPGDVRSGDLESVRRGLSTYVC